MGGKLCIPVKIPIRYIGLGHARCWSYEVVFDLAGSELGSGMCVRRLVLCAMLKEVALDGGP